MPKKKITKAKPLDPVEITILPLAEELAAFTAIMPLDLDKWNSRRFENLFEHPDIDHVETWLDGGGFSHSAKKFRDKLNQFLTRFRKWENAIRQAGVISTEQLCSLQATNETMFWGFKEELDEIYSDAEALTQWLRILAHHIKLKYDRAEKSARAKSKSKPTRKTEYSLPLGNKKWAEIFGFSPKKMADLRESNEYHFKPVGHRKWKLPKHELPAEYLAKYLPGPS